MTTHHVSKNFLKVLVNPENPDIDIIAVHGLNPMNTKFHAEETWTAGDKLWLRDFLPEQLPNARILLFGYNANIAFETSIAGVKEQAVNLLNRVASKREDAEERPIVFIAHSLGGVVVKRALVEAKLDDSYKSIREATHGIAFFGTPHQGGNFAKLGEIAASIVRGILRNPPNTFMEALKKDSLFSNNLVEEFRHLLEDYYVVSFYETLPMGKVGLIVDKKSATLGLYGIRERQIPMDADHAGICKYVSSDGDDYEQVSFNLVLLVKSAVKAVAERARVASLSVPSSKPLLEPASTGYQCLHDLRVTDPRDDKTKIETDKDELLDGSCSWILNDPAFLNWWREERSGLLWIHGDPGKGKTMITMALISEVSHRLRFSPGSGILCYFFCQNTVPELRTATSVLRGLIFFLISKQKNLIHHLQKRYDETERKLFEGSNALYTLWRTLSDILRDPKLPPVYLMIDALDECDPDILRLLEWITRDVCSSPSRVKWLVTSRNEPDIKELLEWNSQLNTSLELNSSYVSNAVNAFIEAKVNELAKRKKYSRDLNLFVKDYLLQNADGTFLWVALVCKELTRVLKIRTETTLQKFPSGLGPLYERMLDRVSNQDDEENAQFCYRVLRSLTLAFRPLSLEEIVVFADLPEEFHQDPKSLEDLVDLCGSFLTIRQATVYFVHQSAKDYFSTGNGSSILFSGTKHEHARIARRCFEVMSSTLKKNICNLRAPGASISEVSPDTLNLQLPAHVRYACLYWTGHIEQSDCTEQGSVGTRDNDKVHLFLREHFLHWLEAISLIGKMSEGVLMITELEAMLESDKQAALSALVHDAKRFIMSNRPIIEEAPLQAYVAAIVFSPKRSLIKSNYLDQLPTWIVRYPVVEEDWSPSLQVLEGHSDSVNAVVFSPDGKVLASASDDRTVRLWDTATGVLRSTLESHFSVVDAVAFSSDGKVLASASSDKTVQLWDTATETLRSTLKGHSGWIKAVAFSPDSKVLASASFDQTVRLWDAVTGALHSTLEGHFSVVNAVAFSPDGKVLASASSDKTVWLWDAVTRALNNTLKGHSGSVSAVAFSPDSKVLASASFDQTVRLWDAATGALHSILEGHSSLVVAVAFSFDGKVLASASYDQTVQLWDAATGVLNSTLASHSYTLRAVAFSPNGKVLASASDGGTLRLWDVVKKNKILEFHVDGVDTLSFTADGSYIKTNRGQIEVPPISGHTRSPSLLFNGWLVRENWLTWDNHRVLWLPPDFRPRCSATQGNVFVMGHSSGRLTFLELDPNRLKGMVGV